MKYIFNTIIGEVFERKCIHVFFLSEILFVFLKFEILWLFSAFFFASFVADFETSYKRQQNLTVSFSRQFKIKINVNQFL